MPPKKAASKKKPASKKSTRSKKRLRKFGPRNQPCSNPKSGYQKYMIKTKKGTRSRCLPATCSRSRNKNFSYPRGDDGHCPRGPVIENIPIGQIAEYEKYRKDLRQASAERSRKNKA